MPFVLKVLACVGALTSLLVVSGLLMHYVFTPLSKMKRAARSWRVMVKKRDEALLAGNYDTGRVAEEAFQAGLEAN